MDFPWRPSLHRAPSIFQRVSISSEKTCAVVRSEPTKKSASFCWRKQESPWFPSRLLALRKIPAGSGSQWARFPWKISPPSSPGCVLCWLLSQHRLPDPRSHRRTKSWCVSPYLRRLAALGAAFLPAARGFPACGVLPPGFFFGGFGGFGGLTGGLEPELVIFPCCRSTVTESSSCTPLPVGERKETVSVLPSVLIMR